MTTDTPNSQRFVESQRWPSPMRPQAIVGAAQRVEEPTDLGWQDVQSALVLIADAHASATPSCREFRPRVRQSKDERPPKVLRIQRAVGRRHPLVLRTDSPEVSAGSNQVARASGELDARCLIEAQVRLTTIRVATVRSHTHP